jgi:hypothetical protein
MKQYTTAARLLGLFTLLFITFTACQKEYSVETGASYTATGTLYDANGNCMSDSVVGTFYDGISPNGTLASTADTAYVLVKVNVATAGSYNITSTTENGVYFSDSGYFTATGIDTIKLKPVGTPIIIGSFTYSISFDSSTCSFTVVTKDSTGTGLGGGGTVTTNPNASDTAWKFTSPTGSYNGIIDTAYTTDSLGQLFLYIAGTTAGDSIFYAGVAFSNGVITAGSYNTSSSALFRFTDASNNTIYSADPTVTTASTVITITSYNSTTNVVTGTFTGTAQNASGTAQNITLGTFTAKLQ